MVSVSSPNWILRELATIDVPMCPGMTTEHLMCGAFTRRSVISASVKPFTANFAALVGGVRHARPQAKPRSR